MPSAQDRESALFALALEKNLTERTGFLQAVCGKDNALRQRLEALLAAHDQRDDRMPAEAARLTIKLDFAGAPDEAVGQTLGRYKLLERVGEGGCGVVYVAEQTEPVRRRVALKVIKLGMDTKQVVARFEAERQALAMMDHPNIAKVLDAGTTDVGRPYFVMELVRGIKITDYCDQANLTTKERLDLFIKVCQAIQHAHQKGIIHRDIKPSNILVTLHDGVPVPKVIDFGIAKATEGRLTDNTVYTQLHQFIGTPAYMSPEQAEMSGLDIDTRSDIYSLGVLLYELLAGSTPFDPKELMASGIDVMRKTIREKEPVRPSARLATMGADELTTTAKRRSAETSKLLHQLKGDLDWIVMKCLEKDRSRRYETANGVAADLKRHLSNEPITARPPSTAYRFQKLVRRNKVMSVAAALTLTAILLGTAISIRQTLRARRELRRALAAEAQAQAEKANAQAALHFIQEDVLSQASPGYQPNRELTVRALLDRIAGRLDGASKRPPLVEASIRQTLGSVYTELGDYNKAIEHFQAALRIQQENLGPGAPDALRSLYGLAWAYWWSGGMQRAAPLTQQGLEESRRFLGEKHPLTLQFMQARASTMMFLGETAWPEVEALFLKTLALERQALGPDDPATLRISYFMSIGYYLNWQDEKTIPLVADSVERSRRVLGEKHPQTAGLMTGLAVAYVNMKQLDKGQAMALRCLEVRRSVLGDEHPLTIAAMLIVARIYVMQDKLEQADALTERALKLCQSIAVENSPFLIWHMGALGWDYLERGRIAQAETLCGISVEAIRRKPDSNPMAQPRVLIQLGAALLAQQQYAKAEILLREGLQLVEKHWPDSGYRSYAASLLGGCLAGQAKYTEAEPHLLGAYQQLVERRSSMPPYLNPSRRVSECTERIVHLYEAWGKPAQAEEWKQKLAAFQQ